MIAALATATILIFTPTNAGTPHKNSLRDISRAADAVVVRAPCRTSPFICFRIDEQRVRIMHRPLYRVLANRSCRTPVERGLAVFMLAHEAGHAHGEMTESGANAYAYRHFSRIARKLHFRNVSGPPRLGAIAAMWAKRGSRC